MLYKSGELKKLMGLDLNATRTEVREMVERILSSAAPPTATNEATGFSGPPIHRYDSCAQVWPGLGPSRPKQYV